MNELDRTKHDQRVGIIIDAMNDVETNLSQDIRILDNIGKAKESNYRESYFGIDIRATEVKKGIEERVELRDNDPFSIQSFTNKGVSWNIAFMDSLLRKEPYLINAINYKSTRVLSNGIDINIRGDKKDNNRTIFINDKLEMVHRKALLNWLFLGIAHGGSGALIVTKGGLSEQELKKPLTPKDIKKGEEIHLRPLTRLYQVQPYYGEKEVYITKIGKEEGIYDSTELGKPKYYKISISGDMFQKRNDNYSFGGIGVKTYIVHRSRLLIYNSSELSWIERQLEQFFGLSIVEKALDSIKAYKQTLDELIKLLKRSNIPVIYFAGLQNIGRTGTAGIDKIDEALISIEYAMRTGDAMVLGQDDKLEYIQAQFSDLSNQLKDRKKELSSILQVPISAMFNEEDEVEANAFDFDDKNIQETQVRYALMQLIPLEYKSLFGEEIPEYSFTFKSLEQVTEKEKIDKLKVASEIIIELFEKNIIDVGTAKSILISASDNVSDMLYELDSAKEGMSEDDKKKFNDFQKELANELQTASIKAKGGNPNTYNMAETKVKGRMMGGDNETKNKNTLDL